MTHRIALVASRAAQRLSAAILVMFSILMLTGPATAQLDTAKPGPASPPSTTPADIEAYYVRFTSGRAALADQAVAELGGEVTHRFDRINAVAVTLPPQARDALSRHPGIEFIEPVPEHRLLAQVVPYNIDQYQARDIWDRNRDNIVDAGAPDGSGVRFCIIDTGFHGPHDDFVGATVSGISQISGENWFEDGNGHGTHVAGTANAVMNDIGVVGAMPGGAELLIVKIFNNSGLWVTGQSNLAAAIQWCADRDANVISMSLGGGPPSATEEALFQSLYDVGVPGDDGIIEPLLSVAAAGNDGNATASYPASYESVISVAAIDEAEVVASFSQYPATAYDPNNPPANVEWDVVELSGGGVNVLSTYPFPDGSVPAYQAIGTQTFDGAHIDQSGFGDVTANLVAGGLCGAGNGDASWNGAVVICERGTFSFAEKVNEVSANGGVAAIIYNNVAGGFSGTCNGACNAPLIPAISLSQAAGQALIAEDLGAPVRVVADDGSSCTTCNGGYAFLSGTSMATPGVAAALALAWDACGGPATITNKDMRQLLRDSAKDLSGTHAGGGGTYGAGWDPATGWGLIQLADARELGNTRFGGACPIGLQVAPVEADVCAADGSTNLTVTLDDQFLGSATLNATGNPAGTSGAFSPNPVVHPVRNSIYTLSGLGAAAGGSYTIALTVVDDGVPANTASGQATLNLFTALPAGGALVAPVDGSAGVELRPTLSWTAASEAASYELQISTSPSFASIVYSANVSGTSHTVSTDLNSAKTYYWRVQASNVCGDGGWSGPFSFTTSALVCTVVPSTNVPLTIRDANNTGPITTDSTLTSSIMDALERINVIGLTGTHTWINDLAFDLISPAGTTVRIMDRSCADQDNFSLSLSDSAGAAWPCPPVGGGTYQPSNPLSAFGGQNPAGTWTLRITDHVRQDSGTLQGWGLEFCVLGTVGPVASETAIDSIAPAATQSVGQTYTVNVSVIGNAPTGTVTVDDGTDSCSITLPATSCELTSTTVGAKTITASYSGDASNTASSDSAAYTITQRSSTTNITGISPAGSQSFNTAYTVSAAVSGYLPAGTVAISDGNGGSCNIILPATSCSLSSTVIGPITISASYAGDANNTASSGSASYEITAANGMVTLSDLSRVYTGSPLGGTVTTSPPGLAVSVTYDGGPEPTDAGSYAVVATITELGYTGSASETFTITPAAATVTLSNLVQAFDGNPKPVSVTTAPASLAVEVTYDGATTAPSAAGSYAIVATVTDPNHTGSASGTLEITTANGMVTLSDLSRVYTGSPLGATVTTSPPGLAVSVTYDGGPEPTDAGSYAVVATITELGYTGSASETFTITPATATVTIESIAPASQQVAGQSYGVTVAVVGPGPSGTVTIDDGNGETCQFDLPATGCDLVSTVLGPTTITASYAGDPNHSGALTSVSYEIIAGPVSSIEFVQQPVDVPIGQPLSPAVQVRLIDSLGNLVADGTDVSIALGNNAAAAVLGGTVDGITTSGGASFADLSLDAAGTGYTLIASAGTVAAESAGFSVLAPAMLQVNPQTADFGDVPVGATSATRLVTLSNTGDLALQIIGIDDAAAPFAGVAGQSTCATLPFELSGGAQCNLAYRFEPDSEGPASRIIGVAGDGDASAFALQGNGVELPELFLSPGAIDFGDLEVGAVSPPETVVVTNLGFAALILDAIETFGIHAAQFQIEWNATGSCSNGQVLAHNDSCSLVLRYLPTAGGVHTMQLRFLSNDDSGPHQVQVRGTTNTIMHDGFEP